MEYKYLLFEKKNHIAKISLNMPATKNALNLEVRDELLEILAKWSEKNMVELTLKLPIADGKTLAWCHEHAAVLSHEADEEWLTVHIRVSPKFQSQVQEWVVVNG